MTFFYLTLSILVLLWAFWGSSWRVLFKPTVIYSVLGGIVALGFAWNMKAVMTGMAAEALVGLSFQFFGASLLVAMYGLRPAVVMLAMVTIIVSFVSGWPLDYALRQYLVLGALPAFVAYGVMYLIGKFLPKHLFIFILGHGYVSGVVSVIVPAILLFSLNQLTVTQQMGLSMDMVDWFITLVILSFTEGSISGMLLAVFVIYKPEWVPKFNDREYLKSSEA